MFEHFNLTTKPYIKMTDNANVITSIFGTSLICVMRAEPSFVYLFIVAELVIIICANYLISVKS